MVASRRYLVGFFDPLLGMRAHPPFTVLPLCTGGHTAIQMKGFSGNGDRSRNLLRGREALAKPPARQNVAHAQRLKTVRGFSR